MDPDGNTFDSLEEFLLEMESKARRNYPEIFTRGATPESQDLAIARVAQDHISKKIAKITESRSQVNNLFESVKLELSTLTNERRALIDKPETGWGDDSHGRIGDLSEQIKKLKEQNEQFSMAGAASQNKLVALKSLSKKLDRRIESYIAGGARDFDREGRVYWVVAERYERSDSWIWYKQEPYERINPWDSVWPEPEAYDRLNPWHSPE